jgi:hypothetical protein
MKKENKMGTGMILLVVVVNWARKENYPITYKSGQQMWTRFPMSQVLVEHAKSFQTEPAVKPGTPDPYMPAKKK